MRAAPLEPLPSPIALPLRRRFGFRRAARSRPARRPRRSSPCAVGLGTSVGSLGTKSPSLSANATRLPASEIISGPNSENDTLIRAPQLAMLKAQLGIGAASAASRIDT